MKKKSVGIFASYAELTKPRLLFMSVLSTAIGFYLFAPAAGVWGLFALTVLGTAMVGAGSMALNEYIERDLDAKIPTDFFSYLRVL